MFPSNLPLAYLALDYFSWLTALALFAGFGSIIVLLGIRSMAGLGAARQWVAIGVRLAVLLVIILILGDIKWVRQNTDVEVMVVRDISRSTGMVHDFPGKFLQTSVDDYLTAITGKNAGESRKPGDKVGEISFNEHAYIDAIPSDHLAYDARAIRDAGNGTDASGAIQLGLASLENDAMHRMLLIWDGNATAGDLGAALAAASSQHVPIDVMPLHYNVKHEVMMDKFIAPTWRQEGQAFSIEVHVLSTNQVEVVGNLSVTNNGKLLALKEGLTTQRIAIKPGKNVVRIEVPAQTPGVHIFHATVDGVANVTASVPGARSDPPASQLDNKSGDIFTFVKGKGQILLVDNMDPSRQTDDARFLRDALKSQQINVVSISPEEFPNDPIQLQSYDAVILANVPRGEGGLNDSQERMLAGYIHDSGGGLLMIGGPNTFGAGGWQGSHLEQQLPVTMEVPAQRQIPKGALVLLMDPAEAPGGNYLGEQCALKAAQALSSQDEIGVISFNYTKGAKCAWDCPLSAKGDGSKVQAAIKNWELGDLPSFEDAVNLALDGDETSPGLIKSDARSKHIIIITDDDPQMPTSSTIQRCKENKISISTITVYPHNSGNIAPGTREVAKETGGHSYGPIETNLNQLPQIFIKEATVVKRSIIHEDAKGIPVTLGASASELVKGIPAGSMPPLYGMDVTGRRDNPLIEVPMVAGAKNDPVLAHWQAGLGKAAVYTGDSFNRWDANWVGSDLYDKFWSQLIRGVSRSPVSSDFELEMTTDGDKGHLIIHAVNEDNSFNNFVNFDGNIAGGPDLTPQHIRPVQTGPGTYEADFDASAQGSYIGYLNYSTQNGKTGYLMAGTVVNSSPELRDLQSNDALLKEITERTGGRLLTPFDTTVADLFSRDALEISSSPRSIWDQLVPFLLGLIILDVAVRRIAWDWASTKRMANAAADYVRQFTTTYRKVESPAMLQSLKRVREEVAEQKFKPTETRVAVPAENRPDPRFKFDAGAGVEGDLSSIVGGATDKPVPPPPKNAQPKGAAPGDHTGGLLEAKRRAQQKIRQKEEAP